MLIRLHRWQPKSNRYRTEPVTLGETAGFLDLIFRAAERVNRDAGVDQRIMRTQHVDRLVFDADNAVIDVYLSPTIIRKYKRKSTGVTVTKKQLGTVTCVCHHLKADHSTAGHINAADEVCIIPGCGCKLYVERQPMSLLEEEFKSSN